MYTKKKLKYINAHINEHINMLSLINLNLKNKIIEASIIIANSLKKKGTIYWCGNGGSASDSLHLSAEFIGKFKKKRKPLKSISLAGNSATLTCIANDYGYENVYSRQIEALGTSKDVLVGISTSGNSKNIVKAIEQAKKKKIQVISLLGNNGGKCRGKAGLDLIVRSNSTARIQETHIMIGHIICDLVEKEMNL
tara:strand:- start:21598 stop:22182 length:585 start_codon:yes stop_codon:yes gene_type:complete